MSLIFALTLVISPIGSFVLFAMLALREYVTLLPMLPPILHAVLDILPFYCTFPSPSSGMFAILIPVYAFLFVPTRLAIAGDTESFLERASTIQWGLMICVYCPSYAPALPT